MNSFYSLCSLLALSGLLSACQKQDGPTLVEGQVIEMKTNKPVPYATIEVYGQRGSGLHTGYNPSATPQQADANGRFSFQFEAAEGTSYLLKAFSKAGHASKWGQEPNVEEGRKNKNLVIPVAAPAWLKIRVEQRPGPVPDAINVWGPWYDQGYISNLDLRPKDYGTVSYHVVDSTLPTTTTVNWEVNYGGQLTRYHQPFTLQPFDTTEVVVRY
ncbi:hypothetical protein ACFPAF_02895 [Hymenobacter endophyticus]|uniref:Carboxypeptidase regulatory-like domain-containing protein n=1 Tax=Hymenobacter endophyticus TaxID=3076335 RepID=A0ABU3TD82_9BACT|nr:hypothetical protein [Hymenobacter endophyticus]MDU0369331.1 hypothetical protein [Hymenobacter endophyticus]